MKKTIIALFSALVVALPSFINAKSGFTMWQLPAMEDNIGNSYVFLTDKGKVVVMDGGRYQEDFYLRGFLAALGNEVEAWFVSHPHDDHMGALTKILENPKGLKIKKLYHSLFSESLIDCEKPYNDYARRFYAAVDSVEKLGQLQVEDLTEPGFTGKIDGMNFKVLGVTNEEFRTNPYNNSSMIVRVWDKDKSIVFLGDAGAECGDKVLESEFRPDLDCDYLQVSHHGQAGCSEKFYKTVKFKACLWPTGTWVWTNDFGAGPGTGTLKTAETRRWMDEIGIKEHHVSCIEGLFMLK